MTRLGLGLTLEPPRCCVSYTFGPDGSQVTVTVGPGSEDSVRAAMRDYLNDPAPAQGPGKEGQS